MQPMQQMQPMYTYNYNTMPVGVIPVNPLHQGPHPMYYPPNTFYSPQHTLPPQQYYGNASAYNSVNPSGYASPPPVMSPATSQMHNYLQFQQQQGTPFMTPKQPYANPISNYRTHTLPANFGSNMPSYNSNTMTAPLSEFHPNNTSKRNMSYISDDTLLQTNEKNLLNNSQLNQPRYTYNEKSPGQMFNSVMNDKHNHTTGGGGNKALGRSTITNHNDQSVISDHSFVLKDIDKSQDITSSSSVVAFMAGAGGRGDKEDTVQIEISKPNKSKMVEDKRNSLIKPASTHNLTPSQDTKMINLSNNTSEQTSASFNYKSFQQNNSIFNINNSNEASIGVTTAGGCAAFNKFESFSSPKQFNLISTKDSVDPSSTTNLLTSNKINLLTTSKDEMTDSTGFLISDKKQLESTQDSANFAGRKAEKLEIMFDEPKLAKPKKKSESTRSSVTTKAPTHNKQPSIVVSEINLLSGSPSSTSSRQKTPTRSKSPFNISRPPSHAPQQRKTANIDDEMVLVGDIEVNSNNNSASKKRLSQLHTNLNISIKEDKKSTGETPQKAAGKNELSLADIFKQRKQKLFEKLDQQEKKVVNTASGQNSNRDFTKEELIERRKEMRKYPRSSSCHQLIDPIQQGGGGGVKCRTINLVSPSGNANSSGVCQDDISDTMSVISVSTNRTVGGAPKGKQDDMIDRLTFGLKAKISKKEAKERSKEHYNNLPEIQKRRDEEKKNAQKMEDLKKRQDKVKEYDQKLRRAKSAAKITKA
jgi:hypothetical protein